MNTPTLHQLQRGLQIAGKIAALEAEMSAIFKEGAAPSSAPATPKARKVRKKHRLSPQALANIRAAQKKRWAKFKSGKAAAKAPAKKRMSPAHKAKLKVAAKKRWA